MIDCYIRPFNDWHIDNPNFDLQKLNFTWNATNYQNNTLKLKLNFSNPVWVTPEFRFDKFVFHIKKKHDFFISKEYLKDLHDNFTTLTRGIRR